MKHGRRYDGRRFALRFVFQRDFRANVLILCALTLSSDELLQRSGAAKIGLLPLGEKLVKKTTPMRRPRAAAAQADSDPYKPARRPAGVGARSGARTGARSSSPRSFDRSERPTRAPRSTRPARDDDGAPRYGARRFGGDEERAPRSDRGNFSDRGGSGFTVNLDPDVARVFRGDASVNKALRLVLQLMQVVQGPPREGAGRFGAERGRGGFGGSGYRGSSESRGFERKPRFEESDDDEE